ncbi:MAG: DUF4366 domain-containing protein [Clostridiales bacterium]|nr:MAG: DUF4366 domain-containing protein [Clostridiales bacterium]
MKMNRIKFAAAVFTAVFALSGMTAFAQSNAPAETPAETVIEDNRTLTPKGNAQLVDDVSDNENLQFITVTARDGNVFYFVIDKGAQSENVYFLNTVDESDLEALVEKSDKKPTATSKPEQTENTAETNLTENDKKNTDSKTEKNRTAGAKQAEKNNSGLFIILALAAAAGIGGYYYKVILPKKKLEQADDLDDFDF